MPVIRDFSIRLAIEDVLRAQGLPETATPRLVELARRALAEGEPLLKPVVAYRHLKVKSIKHERMTLEGGAVSLSGKTIVGALASARQVTALVCTIGGMLEEVVSGVLPDEPALGLALDGVGTAAVEALLEAACARFGEEAASRGWQSSVPFSPGMDGWPVSVGQEQVFNLVEAAEAGVTLSQPGVMRPLKSLSALIGFGPEVDSTGRTCDYCGLRQTCRYQDRYSNL